MKLIAACISFVVFACGAFKPGPPKVTFNPAQQHSSLAPVELAQVRVFDQVTPLPAGITRAGQELFADPGFAHRVLGAVKVVRNKRHDRSTYLAAMHAEAAKHGANALILLDEEGERCIDGNYYCRLGYAVLLSDAPAPSYPSAKASLDSWLAANAAVGRADGPPREVDLATTPTIEVTPRRGECLTFVLALGEEAAVTRHRDRAVLRLQAKSSYLGFNRSQPAPAEWGVKDRVLALDAGCAQGSDPVQLMVRNNLQDAKRPPGTGRAIVQVFKRRADEATLKRQAKELEAADRRGAEARAAMILEACEACYEEWRNCVRADPAIEKGQCVRFNNCVDRRGYSASSCVMHK